FSEPFIAVLPSKHPLAKRKMLTGAELRDEPFVLFTPLASQRAYDKTISICEAHGYRPKVVQEAPQWLTILRLVGAGLGVSIAPASVEKISTPDAVCRRLSPAGGMTALELAYRADHGSPLIGSFCELARHTFVHG